MNNNIVEIDLYKLDADIAEAQNRLNLLISAKKYALSLSKLNNEVKPLKIESGSKFKSEKEKPSVSKVKVKKIKSSTNKPVDNKRLGVTDFIVKFLNGNDKVESKSIIKAYSVYCNKTEQDVEVSVGNGLSRLKANKTIGNTRRPDGGKGLLWFLIKKL